MVRSYKQLDLSDRKLLSDLHEKRVPMDEIAERMDRHRSTIYREIKRNRFVDPEMPDLDGSYPRIADERSLERRARLQKLAHLDDLRDGVIDRLKGCWSPEQIAGRLAVEPAAPHRLCHETIYRFVYSKRGFDLGLSRYLPEQRRRRRPRGKRHRRDEAFPHEVGISNRPARINERAEFGHWECDLVQFRKIYGNRNLTTVVERLTRYTVVVPNKDRQSEPVMTGIADALLPLPLLARQSFTFDRGPEFASWRQFCSVTGSEAWFCDPRSPWQKGAVENTNRRLRRYLPRDTNLASLGRGDLAEVTAKLNATPRKCLGFKTPSEVLRDEIRKIVYPLNGK